jgi:hypothetical protein
MNRDWYEYVVSRLDLPLEIRMMIFSYTFSEIWSTNAKHYGIENGIGCLCDWIDNRKEWFEGGIETPTDERKTGIVLIYNVYGISWRMDVGFPEFYFDHIMEISNVIGLIKLYP